MSFGSKSTLRSCERVQPALSRRNSEYDPDPKDRLSAKDKRGYSPYLPAAQKAAAFIQQLESIALPAEKIAERVHDALTLPNPKVRYHIAPDTMRHVLNAVLPKRMMDRLIAKRLGLMPPAT